MLQESSLEKTFREDKEHRDAAVAAAKKKELDEKAEEKRMEKIIFPYLDSLRDQLIEKNILSFWSFPDRSGFEKLKGLSHDDIKKLIKSDIDKYKNRNIAEFNIDFFHDDKADSYQKQAKIHIVVKILLVVITDKGKLDYKAGTELDFHWTGEDFKITKFSLKLLRRLLIAVDQRLLKGVSLMSTGMPLSYIIKDAKKIRLDLSDVLTPLAGL